MKKGLVRMIAIIMVISVMSVVSASALEINTYSEDLSVYCDGVNVYANSDTAPCIINDRTMVPLKPIFEVMGWEENHPLHYDEASGTVTIMGGDASCQFVNNSNVATQYWSDGTYKEHILDVPATIYNGVFYVPIRAFCEMWGTTITWDEENRRVEISTVYNEANAPESNTISEDEAVARVKEAYGYDEDEGYALSCTKFTYEGNAYYMIEVKALIGNNHFSRMTSYIVSADGQEIFEGYYNAQTGTVTDYEAEANGGSMEQE